MFGSGSSPILYQGLAILWCGPNQSKGRNFLLAVNKETGATAWEHDEKSGSWSTPVIVKVGGQDELLLGMSVDVKGAPDPKTGFLKGLDPKTGKELWHCHGIDSYVYTSALYSNGVAIAMSGYGGAAQAVKLGGTGDITKDRLWRHPKNIQRVGSGLIVGEHVYMVDENGTPHCYELNSGTDLWQGEKRLGATTWGSMVHAAGRLYILMRDGETVVLKASPKFEILATNRLEPGEQTNSSLAISDGEIFIRTFKHLWCIRGKR
jgi:outer membrane protein assembly factor BamB